MKIALFDLDNTLYPEMDFVKSGFNAVASYLHSTYNLEIDDMVSQMLKILEKDGRGKIFDTLLKRLGLYTEERSHLLVYLYRRHIPAIRLCSDVLPVLRQLKDHGIRLGVITDGISSVQKNKIYTLNLHSIFDLLLCTDELGREYWKPSPLSFKIALELFNVSASDAVYIGDDISKDFLGPNFLGMSTIRISRISRINRTIDKNKPFQEAGFVVKRFENILPIIISKR